NNDFACFHRASDATARFQCSGKRLKVVRSACKASHYRYLFSRPAALVQKYNQLLLVRGQRSRFLVLGDGIVKIRISGINHPFPLLPFVLFSHFACSVCPYRKRSQNNRHKNKRNMLTAPRLSISWRSPLRNTPSAEVTVSTSGKNTKLPRMVAENLWDTPSAVIRMGMASIRVRCR